MAKEPFLINPPQQKRKKIRLIKKLKTILKSKRRTTMARAKKRVKVKGKRHRPVMYGTGKLWSRSPFSLSRKAGIKVNPRRKKRKRTYRKLNSPLMIAGTNPVRRKYRKRNAPKQYYRHRQNPVINLGGPMEFTKNMPYIFTGALSATAAAAIPPMILPMLGPIAAGPGGRILGKFAVAIGGGFVVDMVMPRKGHGAVWALVGSGVALADAINEYILKKMGLLSDYSVSNYDMSDYEIADEDGYSSSDYSSMGAFPDTEVGMSAFPATAYQF